MRSDSVFDFGVISVAFTAHLGLLLLFPYSVFAERKPRNPEGIFGVEKGAIEKPEIFGTHDRGIKEDPFAKGNKKKRDREDSASDGIAPLENQHTWEVVPTRNPEHSAAGVAQDPALNEDFPD